LALVLALAGTWGITEWLRGTMFTGFPWNPVGVTLVDTPWRHVVPSIGTYGLSILVVLAGGAIWLAVRRDWKPALGIALALGLLLLLPAPLVPECCLRTFDAQQTASAPAGARARLTTFRIVQPNIGQEEKWRPGLADEAFARLGALSQGGAPPPRLLFWPEVAIPEPFQILDSHQEPLPVPLPAIPRALQSVRPGDVLATGAFALIAGDTGQIVGNTNSVFAIGDSGRVLGRYDKAHLVPYGEYLPMRPLLSAIGLSQLAPGQGDTSYGPGPRTIDLGPFGKMGVQVCYEIIFSGHVVDRNDRPDFIFNPSNDAWFGRWGPPQHLAQARLRAAEEGLPIVRSTPTGISALIAADGTLMASLPWRTAGVIDAHLPPPAPPTPFSTLGNIIPLALGFLMIALAIALGTRRRYRHT
jgi:apolipoprotein N-acyltransferase